MQQVSFASIQSALREGCYICYRLENPLYEQKTVLLWQGEMLLLLPFVVATPFSILKSPLSVQSLHLIYKKVRG